MYDLLVNALLVFIGLTLGRLILQRCMEARKIDCSVKELPNGREFRYRLGIYAGTVRITRKPSCVSPWFVRHVDGWEVVFPMAYSDQEVNEFLLKNDPPLAGNSSHACDVPVYREVVIHRNTALSCVAGQICTISR